MTNSLVSSHPRHLSNGNDGIDAWDELVRHHKVLLDNLDALRDVCCSIEPSQDAIASLRWRIAQASRHRMSFLNDTVFPAGGRADSDEARAKVNALRASTSGYQREISAYVSRWPTDRIIAEWSDYCIAAALLQAKARERVAVEIEVLQPALLKRLSFTSYRSRTA